MEGLLLNENDDNYNDNDNYIIMKMIVTKVNCDEIENWILRVNNNTVCYEKSCLINQMLLFLGILFSEDFLLLL